MFPPHRTQALPKSSPDTSRPQPPPTASSVQLEGSPQSGSREAGAGGGGEMSQGLRPASPRRAREPCCPPDE